MHYQRWRKHGDPTTTKRLVKRPCTIEGCGDPHLSRGWCAKHYMRWYSTGTTDLLPRQRPDRTQRACSVDGCTRPVWSREMCNLHYCRLIRSGEVGPAEVLTAPKGSGHLRADGYRVIQTGHPLSTANGQVLEHRAVLYDTLGPDPQPCAHCGMEVRWDHTYPTHADALVVDHLDFDRSNNDPANLVPSCGRCNLARTSVPA